jgi:DNA-binding beta-propeller fold protein YncE
MATVERRSVVAFLVLALLAFGCAIALPAYSAVRAGAGSSAVARFASSTGGACSTAVARGRQLAGVKTAFVSTAGGPNGVVSTPDGKFSFLWLSSDHEAVFSDRAFAPASARLIAMPAGLGVMGQTVTADGRYLLAASGDGAVVVSVQRAEDGRSNPVLGTLSAGSGSSGFGGFAINVVTAPDSAHAFVTVEYSHEIAVFDLRAAIASGFHGSHLLGTIPIPGLSVGLALSPDGKWLYATSEAGGGQTDPGAVSVIDVGRAEQEPSKAVVATAAAGACGTVRDVVSADGQTLWVTARDSNQLLAFSTAKLRSDPSHARIAALTVGGSPEGLALVNRGQRVIVADQASNGLTVVNTTAALAGKPAVLGTIKTGETPRDISLEPNGTTALVTNRQSRQLEAVNLAQLP